MKQDTMDFLEAMLFGYNWEDSELNEEDITVFDIDVKFVEYIDAFIEGFYEFLSERDVEFPDSERSFGGNIYWSLSGHGAGFWDSSETEYMQEWLEGYAGHKYKFEQVGLWHVYEGTPAECIRVQF